MVDRLRMDMVMDKIVGPTFKDVPRDKEHRIHAIFTSGLLARACFERDLDPEADTFKADALSIISGKQDPTHLAGAEIVFDQDQDLAALVVQACRNARDFVPTPEDLIDG
jgi:hypothetical protein